KRVLVTLGAAGTSVLILLPTLVASQGYGRTLRATEEVTYPELGPRGRYSYAADRIPFASFPDAALEQAKALFRPAGEPLFKSVNDWTKTRKPTYRDSYGQALLEM